MNCCASIVTVVTRACHNVLIYVSLLSCYYVLLLTLRYPKWSLSQQVFFFCLSLVCFHCLSHACYNPSSWHFSQCYIPDTLW